MALDDIAPSLVNDVTSLGAVLDKRVAQVGRLDRYADGSCDLPAAVVQAKVTKAYRMLMPMADAPWGGLVVDSAQDRLEVVGLRDGQNADTAKRIWEAWQANQMDAESKLGHIAALTSGRAFATVWPARPNEDHPSISLDAADTMVVKYAPGSRTRRLAAMRRWYDEDERRPYVTLYRPDGVYKFQGPKNTSGGPGTQWERRVVGDEEWPLPNPFPNNEVPVVEIAVNRRLRPGAYPYARGEFEHCIGLIDRINLLTFLGLVVAFWMGFPLRAVIGDRILKDDDGNPLPPFEATADSVAQFEKPDVKLDQYDAADRSNLSIYAELSQFATITKTPRHYFPYDGGMSNISADAIRADEGGLNAKVVNHKSLLGEGWLETDRLVGLALPEPAELSADAEVLWADHESRSLAERADAASKLNGILPWQALAERVLNANQDEITRWSKLRESDARATLAAALVKPVTQGTNGTGDTSVPEPAPQGG